MALIFSLAASVAYATSSDELDDLLRYAKMGAPQLAIQLVQQHQPDIDKDKTAWVRWERALFALMREEGQWRQMERRIAQLPQAKLPLDVQRWFSVQHATALLQLGRYQEARTLLATRLWGDSGADARSIATWRHLLIQSYLQQGLIDDAYDAMLRYRQDYGDADREALLLRAEVLLRHGRPRDARVQLADMDEERESPALRLLADLRSGGKPAEIVREVQRRLKTASATSRLRLLLLGIVAEGNELLNDHAAQAVALEQFYATPNHDVTAAGLFSFNAATLWSSYRRYGQQISNKEQMLVGDDAAWFKAAEAAARLYPIRSRSLYTLLAEQATSSASRLAAHRALLAQLGGKEGNLELVKALYLESHHFGSEDQLPAPVRYFLYDGALNQGDLTLASRLLRSLEKAPADVSQFDWELRSAKVFMLSGSYQQAVDTLQRLLASNAKLNEEQFNRVMQLLFDLQTVGEHEGAITLFEALAKRPLEQRIQRELLYWIGDSQLGRQRYLDAARYYLRSATLPGPDAMDPWAETARYQAAKALAQAGLTGDARVIYLRLLEITTDPSRRAVLQHELEQLRLLTKDS